MSTSQSLKATSLNDELPPGDKHEKNGCKKIGASLPGEARSCGEAALSNTGSTAAPTTSWSSTTSRERETRAGGFPGAVRAWSSSCRAQSETTSGRQHLRPIAGWRSIIHGRYDTTCTGASRNRGNRVVALDLVTEGYHTIAASRERGSRHPETRIRVRSLMP